MGDNGERPARRSTRIAYHEKDQGRGASMESVAFARRRDKRRAAAKAARAARKKNRR
jgi:hypothetical protein